MGLFREISGDLDFSKVKEYGVKGFTSRLDLTKWKNHLLRFATF
jgi:hypothetical protein